MAELTAEEKKKIYLEEKARLEARQQLQSGSQNIAAGGIAALFGGLLLSIGPALPWATLGAISADGFRKAGDYAIFILIAGVVAALAGAVSFLFRDRLNQARPVLMSYLIALCGIAGGILLGIMYPQLSDNVSSIKVLGHRGQIGIGFWLSCIGAFIVLISSTLLHPRKKKK